MLSSTWLESAPDPLIALYAQSEQDILAFMASRISAMNDFIPAAQWQYYKLREMGLCRDEILKQLAKAAKKTETELWNIIRESGFESIKDDDAIYEAAGLNPGPASASVMLKDTLNGGYMNTRGTMENITKTTANTATRQFERALDRAWMNVSTGAYSKEEAVKSAVKKLSADGIGSIEYPTGHMDTIDVAVSRAVRTGVNQTALKMQMARAQELGCDLVEVSAHAGARVGIGIANHAGWQGKVYSISGINPKYPNFEKETGYGSGAGLGGWNCRHSFRPYFEGSPRMYTEDDLADMNAPKYSYNGTKLTEYEATQKQRYIERQIRRWKREYKAMEAAGQDTSEAAGKIKKWQDTQRDFIKQTGLKLQSERSQVAGFGRSEAASANAQARALKSLQDDAIIKKQSGLPKRVDLPDEPLKTTISVDFPNIHGVVPKGVTLTDVYVMAGDGTSVPIRDLKRLYETYGGISKWQKKSGKAYAENFRYVVHWYERDGFAPPDEGKMKGVKRR